MKLFFYFLGCISVFAQSFDFEATYTIDFNTDFPRSFESTLFISSQDKIAYYILDYGQNKSTYFDESQNAVVINSANSDDFIVYNKLDDYIISLEESHTKSYWVKDTIDFNWLVHDETKLIDKYVVHKATTHFRGKDYIAWYNKDIPIPMGPYKFYGLPGLIMEIYDIDNVFHWSLNKFEQKNIKSINTIYPVNQEFLTIRQFVELKDEEIKQLSRNIKSRVGRELNVKSVISSEYVRKGIETKFDWEN